jgi:5-aminolevulinate synthase
MLLKCRFLAQFSVAELKKNAMAVSQAENMCPFMSHARRALSTGVTNSSLGNSRELSSSSKPIEELSTEPADSFEPIVEKRFDDLLETPTIGFDYNGFFQAKIDAKKKDGSYRQFKKIIRSAELFPQVQETNENFKRDVTIWCSNDYLGLGRHPYVQAQVCKAVEKYGVGSGGTRNISGSNPLHEQLESELAK